MTSNDEYVLQILLENQVVSKADADKAALKVAGEGASVVDILVNTGVLSEEQVLGTLAQTFGMEFVDISQVELSERVGLSRVQLNRILNGHKPATFTEAVDIAAALDLDPSHRREIDRILRSEPTPAFMHAASPSVSAIRCPNRPASASAVD